MAYGTLQAIYQKARKMTGSATDLQLTDPVMQDYLDSFYLFDFPAQFRSLKLKDRYIFNTIQGQDTYPFDSERYTTVEMPCQIEKTLVQLFQDPGSFYGAWGYNMGAGTQFEDNFDFGDGTTGPYGGTLTAIPIIGSVNNDPVTNPNRIGIVQNLLITANTVAGTLNVTDKNLGNGTGELIGDVDTLSPVGTINYQTGVITGLVFNQAVPSGNQIQCQYLPVVLDTPEAILFFQNQFTIRPVPDKGYTVELIAYRRPSQALSNPNNFYPELTEWWETLAVGLAKKIYEDRMDSDGIARMESILEKHYDLIETRTYAQLGKQRAGTIFAGQLDNMGGTGLGFLGYGSGVTN
jgi:hypothetical protein